MERRVRDESWAPPWEIEGGVVLRNATGRSKSEGRTEDDMKTRRSVGEASSVWIVALLVGCAIGLQAQADPKLKVRPGLANPYKEAVCSPSFIKELPPPVFSHGYFTQFKRDSTSRGETNIYLWDSICQNGRQLALWPTSAVKMQLTAVDVGAGGGLAFSGHTEYADGSIVAFVATSGLDGKNTVYFDTGAYLATQIAVAGDGSLWTVGAEGPDLVPAPKPLPGQRWNNYGVLRHFSTSGMLIAQYIARWGDETAYVTQNVDASGEMSLQTYDKQDKALAKYGLPFYGPLAGYGAPPGLENQAWLKSTKDGMVLYDGRSGILYRYNNAEGILRNRGVDRTLLYQIFRGFNPELRPLRPALTALGVSDSGRVFASAGDNPRETFEMPEDICELVHDSSPSLAGWVRVGPVPGNRLLQPAQLLLGMDGESVVYRHIDGHVAWAEVH